ncbi:carbon-nitrogen hydrolase family protein [Nocardia sp. NBC_00508]|uniref:carbon-nitrogen hydrolase family protein n=1 Tax=Nocardia sp. NBC_00508 TaxID=2975992 RepID=UPI002E807E81|nr:carbon-nitrogen hydrolase family protein [Nocardia sp. NBC_00508]WUD66273.1 carbon-nitrogen hydrolase family protein [Nocardia sp. NBC_00508]
MVRAAAVQLVAVPGDISANLAACERLADEAGRAGAKIIALPEFFSTGIGFLDQLADAALPFDGAATALLCRVARRFEALVGGSFLCRDGDGQVRNAYLLADATGVLGRHDKDLPTMWENAFYIGGHDDGVLTAGAYRIGAAVCWELMRTRTVRRLRGRVDLVMTGSGWWSVPKWLPHSVFARLERRNAATARNAAATFSRYVGAPVVHAGHAGELACPMPWLPVSYRGHFEGATMIVDADGTVLAERRREDGEGIVQAEIEPGSRRPELVAPERFWLHRRGVVPTAAWHYQRWHGRRWYRANVVIDSTTSRAR